MCAGWDTISRREVLEDYSEREFSIGKKRKPISMVEFFPLIFWENGVRCFSHGFIEGRVSMCLHRIRHKFTAPVG